MYIVAVLEYIAADILKVMCPFLAQSSLATFEMLYMEGSKGSFAVIPVGSLSENYTCRN